MSTVLDAGALIAIDRGDRRIGPMLLLLQGEGTAIRTSAAAVAQVWRDGRRQVKLLRVLRGVETVPLDEAAAKKVGDLLAANGTSDVVDAHVALLVEGGGRILTADEDDIKALLRSRRVSAAVLRV